MKRIITNGITNLELLAEQTYDRLLEKESLTAGWSDCYKGGEEL